jgi:hypothetical protein
MLRASVLNYGSDWEKCLPYAEFSYNNSYQASIKMSPFEAVPTGTLDIQDTLEYKEHPIRILGRDTKVTRSKTIPMCKIQWSNHTEREATWEKESDLRLRYPYLFEEYVTI